LYLTSDTQEPLNCLDYQNGLLMTQIGLTSMIVILPFC
jgi:hypothetical protein